VDNATSDDGKRLKLGEVGQEMLKQVKTLWKSVQMGVASYRSGVYKISMVRMFERTDERANARV